MILSNSAPLCESEMLDDQVFLEDNFSRSEIELIRKHLGLRDKQILSVIAIYRKFREHRYDSKEWFWRLRRAARSLLTSAALAIASKDLANSKSMIMCIVSNYYSLFHGSFALLCQHPEIQYQDLQRIKHDRLSRLIDSYFVRSDILSPNFVKELTRIRTAREAVNYSPDSLRHTFPKSGFSSFLSDSEKMNKELLAANFVLSRIIPYDNLDVTQLYITLGESMADDWLWDFCSDKSAREAWDLLVEFGLST